MHSQDRSDKSLTTLSTSGLGAVWCAQGGVMVVLVWQCSEGGCSQSAGQGAGQGADLGDVVGRCWCARVVFGVRLLVLSDACDVSWPHQLGFAAET